MWDDSFKIMVFRPTLAEFENFSSYIELMEEKGAHSAGLAKVLYYKILILISDFIVTILHYFSSKYVILIL